MNKLLKMFFVLILLFFISCLNQQVLTINQTSVSINSNLSSEGVILFVLYSIKPRSLSVSGCVEINVIV